MQERIESAVWFYDASHPLQLDALPDHLDLHVLEHCVVNVSTDLLTSSLRYMPKTVDLRTQLAQRVACALRLRDVLGRNGYLAQLSISTRIHLRADAELLAGASDLWRLFDAGEHAAVLVTAIESVLGPGCERVFFEQALPRMVEILAALHAQLTPSNAVVCTRLVLALFLGATRFRLEHGAAYQQTSPPSSSAFEPWYASPVCVRLLESLFDAAINRLEHTQEAAADAELRTQLCALAEQALNAYEAREAFLSNDADGLAAAQAAFSRARPSLLRPLLGIGRADKAFALAEHHRDFHTLVVLCFADPANNDDSKRIKLMNPASSDSSDVRVELYLDAYGMDFANELYQYYIKHGAVRRLLEPRAEHAHLVSRFLDEHPQYSRLAWVHDSALDQYERASSTLRACAQQERLDVQAKQRMLSIGKLLHLASLPSMEGVSAPAQQATLETWDDALDLVHIQTRLHARWVEATLVDENAPAEAQAEHIASSIAPLLDNRPTLRTLFVSFASGVIAGHVVTGEDIIDLLTLADRSFAAPQDSALTDFAIAVQVLVRLDLSSARRDAALVSLWRRLYLMDDWEALSDTASLTDEQVLQNVQNTTAFHTLQSVLADDSTAETVISPESICTMAPPDLSLLKERLQGLPDTQIQAIHDAFQEEHDALAHTVECTRLSAYFSHILSVRLINKEDWDMDDEDAPEHKLEDTTTPLYETSMPGASTMLM